MWTIVVPLKALPEAKSRLADGLDPAQHARLVEAIRADTFAAVAASTAVARTLVVFDRAPDDASDYLPLDRLVQSGVGLNAAIREAATAARDRWPGTAVAALVGDLPALRSAELQAALDLAAEHPRSFVADSAATGTTLLTARPGCDLSPAFGLGSASQHARIAQSLPAGPGLRLDVDTAADLQAAQQLGVGPATRAVLRG